MRAQEEREREIKAQKERGREVRPQGQRERQVREAKAEEDRTDLERKVEPRGGTREWLRRRGSEEGEKKGREEQVERQAQEARGKQEKEVRDQCEREEGERRRESGEKRKPEIECAKTEMCRIRTCHGGMGHGGSKSTTDRHVERQEADGECGAQPPEQPLRLRDRNGEKESGIRKCNENTLHVVLHLPINATTAAAPPPVAAAPAMRMQ